MAKQMGWISDSDGEALTDGEKEGKTEEKARGKGKKKGREEEEERNDEGNGLDALDDDGQT